MKRIVATFGLVVFGCAIVLYIVRPWGMSAGPHDLDGQLHGIVEDVVATNPSIRNCVLAVAKGDGSFTWAGAAGVAHQEGRVAMTADAPIYIASITKLYTATVVMRLYETGALALDDPMAKYLPAQLIAGINTYQGTDHSRDITVGDLLSHRSGIADYYLEQANDQKSLAEWLRDDPERQWTVEQTIARARDELKARSKPGTETYYSDTNYQLLGMLIEAVTGKPLAAAYDDLLFRPLGLRHTWLIGHAGPPSGPFAAPADVFHAEQDITRSRGNEAYWADGGIVATAQDMIVFLQALNQGRIIRRDTLELMHRWHSMDFPFQYGYGTMYLSPPGFIVRYLLGFSPVWGHSGSIGAFLYYAPERDLYMAGTIDQTEAQTKPFVLMWRVMNAVGARNNPS